MSRKILSNYTVNTKKLILGVSACVGLFSTTFAQNEKVTSNVYTHTDTVTVVNNSLEVITNPFWSNWFVQGNVGVNSYRGDNPVGSLKTRLTPQFNVGIGKWITPGMGMQVQFTGFHSKAHKGVEGLYTRGSQMYTDANGKNYWKERIDWYDISVNGMFNLSRLILGYEGDNSPKRLNQFIASIGIGATHHYNLPYGSANEWSGHLELQYSRFFSARKNLSLDVKFRGLYYETQYDGVKNHQKYDQNVSLNIGMTYYLRRRGWGRTVSNTTIYRQDNREIARLNDEINRLKNQRPDTVVVEKAVQLKNTVTFPYLVNFVIDKVDVANREKVNLKTVAEMIKATPDQKYLICGYADKFTGSKERNIWLAKNRAQNVFKVLTEEFGIPASQLVVEDKGGVDNMYYNDPQLSRSAIISKYNEQK